MASSMVSTTTVAVSRSTTPAQASMVAPFNGLRSTAAFPRKNADITTLANNGGRVSCMKVPAAAITLLLLLYESYMNVWILIAWVVQVWPTEGLKKFETLSYLPPLTREQLLKEVEYLLRQKLIPCLEFELKDGFVYRENNKSPGYYDGRYWTMWKLPMFGCSDAVQVLNELDECVKTYPTAFVRIIGFDNIRQVQICSFIAHRPQGF